MSTKAHYAQELSYFNAISCLLVIFIHVVSYAITTATPSTLAAALVYFPWRLAAFVVPGFLFSSAAKMAFRYEAHTGLLRHGSYFLGRVRAIFLPYVGWNLIYYGVFMSIGYVQPSTGDFFRQLFTGTLSAPFYYIIIAMQFYFLRPLWFWVLDHLRWYVAIPGAVVINFLSLYLNSILQLWDAQFLYTDRIFTSYLVFWVVGLYAGRNWDHLTQGLARGGANIPVSLVLILAVATVPYLNYSRGIWLFDTTYHKIFTDLLSIMVLLWLCLKLCHGPGWIKRGLGFISAASFPVYLSHCLFLTLTERHLYRVGATDLTPILLVRFLVCYSAPFLLYAITHRLRPNRLRH